MPTPTKNYQSGKRFEIAPGYIEITCLEDGTEIDAEPSYEWDTDTDNQKFRKWTFPFGYFVKPMTAGEKFVSAQRVPMTIFVKQGSILVAGRSGSAPDAEQPVVDMMRQINRAWRSQKDSEDEEMADLRRMSGFDDPLPTSDQEADDGN